MNQQLKEAKQAIRAFFPNYTDSRLVELLAHCQSGRIGFSSCCCFIGVSTANHALQSGDGLAVLEERDINTHHYTMAKMLAGAKQAEDAFYYLGKIANDNWQVEPALRTRRLISIVKAEIRRRDAIRAQARALELVAQV